MEQNLWLRITCMARGDSNIPEMGREKDKKKGRKGERCEVHKDSFIHANNYQYVKDSKFVAIQCLDP